MDSSLLFEIDMFFICTFPTRTGVSVKLQNELKSYSVKTWRVIKFDILCLRPKKNSFRSPRASLSNLRVNFFYKKKHAFHVQRAFKTRPNVAILYSKTNMTDNVSNSVRFKIN